MKRKYLCLVMIFSFIFCGCFLCGCGATEQKIAVDSIQISKKNIYLAEGQTAVISAQVYPFNANNQNVIWTSTNSDVVKIENGFITALKAGDATIEVVSEEGGYKDTCNVLVTTAENNLALNDYNNLNMPPKDLEPIYDASKQSTKKNTIKKYAKNLVAKANSELANDKDVAIGVVTELKTELQNSINNLNKEKQYLTEKLSSTTNSFGNMFYNIQNQIVDSISNIKQEMLSTLENAEQDIESDEYTVQNGNMNGVTFVVISNK